MLDEHGMPVPPEHTPIPLWIEHERFTDTVRDADDQEVNLWDSPEFFVHAANWIVPCREIVRRLGKPQALSLAEMEAIMLDAANLWSEMQEDVKGGDDE